MRLAKRLAFLGFDFRFGFVKGQQPLNSLWGEWSPEVGRGESKHPSLPLARAERKPLDQKRKHPPRYQRENHFWFSFGARTRPPIFLFYRMQFYRVR